MNSINVIYRKEVRMTARNVIIIRESVDSGEGTLSQSPAVFHFVLVIIPFLKLSVRKDMNMRRHTQSRSVISSHGTGKPFPPLSHHIIE